METEANRSSRKAPIQRSGSPRDFSPLTVGGPRQPRARARAPASISNFARLETSRRRAPVKAGVGRCYPPVSRRRYWPAPPLSPSSRHSPANATVPFAIESSFVIRRHVEDARIGPRHHPEIRDDGRASRWVSPGRSVSFLSSDDDDRPVGRLTDKGTSLVTRSRRSRVVLFHASLFAAL